MIILDTKAKLTDLQHLIDKVDDYPISARQLTGLAKKEGAGSEIVDFYKAFPDNACFTNREDLLARTEQVEIMETESPPAEDVVHGAED
ncbi:MAG TPA: hypothetical protein VFP35_02430 [Candidatus Saccharimonadales bacterium]|nr:hypothetical protein [Candidatus Saccharimonadales bacterium]